MLCWLEFFCVVLVSVGVKFAWFRASSGFMSVTVSMARGMALIRKHMKFTKFGKVPHPILSNNVGKLFQQR